MKKYLLSIVLSFVTIISALAVPSGLYADKYSRNQVLVSNGEICFLDKDGYVTTRLRVVSENSDGSFTVRDCELGITSTKNAWWTDEDGTICLNLEHKIRTLYKIR